MQNKACQLFLVSEQLSPPQALQPPQLPLWAAGASAGCTRASFWRKLAGT